MAAELDPGERELGNWTVNYIPPDGGRYTGKLTVTNERLHFDAKFDTSVVGTMAEAAFVFFGSEGELIIDKSGIQDVEVSKKLLKKQVIVVLEGGSRHVFDYGALSVDAMADAIRER